MSKQAITVDGEERIVREDTAKAFRGVHWALLSVGAFVLIVLILFLGGFLSSSGETGTGQSPASVDRGVGSGSGNR